MALREFTGLSLANLVAACASFISLVVLARTLAVEEFAQLTFALSTTWAAFALLDPRLEDALVRFLPVVDRDRGGPAASRLFERTLLVDGTVNITFGVVGLALLLFGAIPDGGIAVPVLLSLAVLQVAAQGPMGTMSAAYAITHGLARWGILQSAATVGATAASLIGLAIAGSVGFLAAGAIAAALTSAALGVITIRRVRETYGAPDREGHPLPHGFISFTVRAAANSSVSIGAEALPLTVIGLRASASTLAGFRVALGPGRLIAALVSPVAAVIYPRASKSSAARQPDVAAREALQLTRKLAPVAALLLGVGAIAMPAAIAFIFGSSYRDFSTTATALLAAALVRGTVAWSKTLPLALGDPTRRLLVSLFDVAAVVGAAAIFADTSHAFGVSVAYVAIALAVALYWLSYARMRTRRTDELTAGPHVQGAGDR